MNSEMNRLHFIISILTLAGAFLLSCGSGKADLEYGIRQGQSIVKVALHRVSDTASYLSAHTFTDGKLVDSSRWELPFPVYHFEVGDVNGDGTDDIAVGVTKATRFDRNMGKRIFLFQLQDGSIIPLWLGSRVSQPLFDFRLLRVQERKNIRTIEKEQDGSYLVAEYEWYGFGLGFVRYVIREASLARAKKAINNSI